MTFMTLPVSIVIRWWIVSCEATVKSECLWKCGIQHFTVILSGINLFLSVLFLCFFMFMLASVVNVCCQSQQTMASEEKVKLLWEIVSVPWPKIKSCKNSGYCVLCILWLHMLIIFLKLMTPWPSLYHILEQMSFLSNHLTPSPSSQQQHLSYCKISHLTLTEFSLHHSPTPSAWCDFQKQKKRRKRRKGTHGQTGSCPTICGFH